jgi:hypothetical protein
VALEQSLGNSQTLSVSYVGASDSHLIASEIINNLTPDLTSVTLAGGVGTSSYNALQVLFQRRLTHGLQAHLSYTWSHSIDNTSYGAYENGSFANINENRGPSDFDLRNVLTAAVTYQPPVLKSNFLTRAITSGWSTDDIVQIRSGAPIDVIDENFQLFLGGGSNVMIRPDVVPDQPEYLTGSQYPGGRALNPAAFTAPPLDPITGNPTRQGNLSRNARRAYGIEQWDFAARRDFPIHEGIKLQFRGELFNVLNHPSFGPFNNEFETHVVNGSTVLSNPLFGHATQMLNQYLGGNLGGQNPLYTPGGPRAGELALRLEF